MKLELDKRNKLVNLLVNTGKAETGSRSALCRRIGVEPNTLSFISGGSVQDFATNLVDFLYQAERYKELINLCEEIEPELGDYPKKELMAIRPKLEKLASQPEESPGGDEQPKPPPSPETPPSPEHQSIIELVNEACVSIQRVYEILDQYDVYPVDCRTAVSFLEKIKQIVDNLWRELNSNKSPHEHFEKLYRKVRFDRYDIDNYINNLITQLNQFHRDCRPVTPETQKKHKQLQKECEELRDILFGWQASTSQIVSENIRSKPVATSNR